MPKTYQYLLEQKSKNGFMTRVVYTGALRNKPRGWRVVKRIGTV